MAMQMLHFKEHDGVLSNLANGAAVCSAMVGAVDNGDSSGHLSSPEVANGNNVSADAADSKSSGDAQKSLVATSPQSECTRFNLGFGQPMVCAKYPYGDQLYGLFSSSGPQVPGRMMLPLNLTTDEGMIYVNAKQYHGIPRCCKSRAKFEGENKATRGRKVPYMHVSRHLHAMHQPRGSDGRFLNTKNVNNVEGAAGMKKDVIAAISQPTSSLRLCLFRRTCMHMHASHSKSTQNNKLLCFSKKTFTLTNSLKPIINHLHLHANKHTLRSEVLQSNSGNIKLTEGLELLQA